MEFGTSIRIPGKSIIGISWTSFRNTKEANLLITTSESRIQIYSADDQRVISSWLTRPGSYNRFTVAAVQHRTWRQLFAVQNETKLYSWNENQTSLENAVKIKVRNDVFCLRTSKHIPALVCVYRDGGISIYNEHLHELFYTAGVGSGTSVAATTRDNTNGTGTNQVTTWARLTSVPGQPNCCVLMVLTQSLPDNNPSSGSSSSSTTTGKGSSKTSSSSLSSSSSAANLPTLRVFTLSTSVPTKSSASVSQTTPSSSGPTVSLKYITTHTLLPPSSSSSSSLLASPLRITSITLHKHLHQLGIFWNTGLMQMLQFIPNNRSQVLNWFSCPLVQVLTRELSKILPENSSSSTLLSSSVNPSSSFLHVAAFGLEPSCVVLAGNQGKTIGMSVWDVRYGIMLDIKSINEENISGEIIENDYEQPEDFTTTTDVSNNPDNSANKGSDKKTKKGNRNRSDSTGSNTSVGSLLSSAQAIAGGDLTPDSVFQITVSEDGSFVAIAARNRIFLTPVAVRGASLASALGRLVPTQSLLAVSNGTLVTKSSVYPSVALPIRQDQPVSTVPVSVAPVINLQNVLDTVLLSSSSNTTLSSSDKAVSLWSNLLSNEANTLQKDVTNILNKTVTPSLTSIVKILAKYDNRITDTMNVTVDADAAEDGGNGSTKDAKKRKTVAEKKNKNDDTSTPSFSPVTTKIVPPVLVAACTQRCIQELVDKYESSSGTTVNASLLSLPLEHVALLLNYLVTKKYLTFTVATDLYTTLLTVLSTCSRNHQTIEGVTILLMLRNMLLTLTDIPETLLIQTFTTMVQNVSSTILSAVWEKISTEIQQQRKTSASTSTATAPSTSVTAKSVLGLLYLTSLIIRAPRNDVFLENSLSSLLDNNQLNILLACIARLLALHTTNIIAPSSTTNNPKRLRKEYTIDDEESYTDSTVAVYVNANILLGSNSNTSSSFIYFPLPSYGQVLDWIRMVIDSHFARIILLAKANQSLTNNQKNTNTKKLKNYNAIQYILRDIQKIIQAQTRLCDEASDLQGHLTHILQRLPLPQPPEPEYSIDTITL